MQAARRCTREPGRGNGIDVSQRREIMDLMGPLNLFRSHWLTHQPPVSDSAAFRQVDNRWTVCMVSSSLKGRGNAVKRWSTALAVLLDTAGLGVMAAALDPATP